MILVVNTMGQTCNRLLLFAHTLATALKTHQSLVFVFGSDIHRAYILSGSKIRNTKVQCWNLGGEKFRMWVYKWLARFKKYLGWRPFSPDNRKRYVETMPHRLSEIKRKPGLVHPILVWDFMWNRAMREFRSDIVSFLSFREEHRIRPLSFLSDLRARFDSIVGVHVRRGDYKHFHEGKYFFDDPLYARFISSFGERFPRKAAFVLVSNEPIDVRQIGGLSQCADNVFSRSDTNMYEDLYLLSECDFIMGPPSTFSWWAAFYGGKPLLVLRSKDETVDPSRFSLVSGDEHCCYHWKTGEVDPL